MTGFDAMKFSDTGLVNDKLVEQAFDYAYAHYTQLMADEIRAVFTKRFNRYFEEELNRLDAGKKAGTLSEDAYAKGKAKLEKLREEQQKFREQQLESNLVKTFAESRLGSAVEIQIHSENSSPALIAATLLLDCARDPVEYKQLEKKFGDTVAGLIAEVLHVEDMEGLRDTRMIAASSDAKRILIAVLANDHERIFVSASEKEKSSLTLWDTEEQKENFNEARLLWGNDKKLDARIVDTFNRAAGAVSSRLRIEVDAKGAPELVKITQNITKTALGKKPGNFGDDGF